MTVQEIITAVSGELVLGDIHSSREVAFGFTSDLMSDVLTQLNEDILLITGLANTQSIRTAVLSDIHTLLFVRGKKPTAQMIELAREHDITLLTSPFSAFKASALLYTEGLLPIF